jgi:hypothetical protein
MGNMSLRSLTACTLKDCPPAHGRIVWWSCGLTRDPRSADEIIGYDENGAPGLEDPPREQFLLHAAKLLRDGQELDELRLEECGQRNRIERWKSAGVRP